MNKRNNEEDLNPSDQKRRRFDLESDYEIEDPFMIDIEEYLRPLSLNHHDSTSENSEVPDIEDLSMIDVDEFISMLPFNQYGSMIQILSDTDHDDGDDAITDDKSRGE